nr:class I SAM-dependent methyltransferase [uncultured Bacillus sp.]
MEWTYHHPSFEYDKYKVAIRNVSAWTGHRAFAYDLVRFLKPNRIVELGTHYGTSFFSFCQAVKDGGLSTTCYAVDTWKGDPQSGYYNHEVLELVQKIRNQYYSGMACVLLPATFDQAVHFFEDRSIDLLHIDGYHSYEAVLHDYQTWLPKVSEKGVVLFHDIAVKAPGYGVQLLWEQLKKQYPAIEFSHSFGLGVLFPKGHTEEFNKVLQKNAEMQRIYNA